MFFAPGRLLETRHIRDSPQKEAKFDATSGSPLGTFVEFGRTWENFPEVAEKNHKPQKIGAKITTHELEVLLECVKK